MIGIAGVALDHMMQSRAGRWALLISFLSCLVLGAVFIDGETARHGAAIKRGETALQMWLNECGKPLDECAAAWDRSYTLRELYYERAALQPPA